MSRPLPRIKRTSPSIGRFGPPTLRAPRTWPKTIEPGQKEPSGGIGISSSVAGATPVTASSNAEDATATYPDANVTKGNANGIQQSTYRRRFAHP